MMTQPTARKTCNKCDMDDLLSDGLLTVREAAQFLSIGQSTVYEMMYSGRLAYTRIGRSRRIPKRVLIELVKAGLAGPIPDASNN